LQEKTRKYLQRNIENQLNTWINDTEHMPLLIRGACHFVLALNKGAIAELNVGLELIKSANQRIDLYFWHREFRNSQAEVDYLVQHNAEIIPIEVKSGTKGSMQSLYLFLDEKRKSMAFGFHKKILLSSTE